MTIKEFFESEEKLAIHCDTKEQADRLIQKFDQLGYKWVDGSCYTNFGYDRRICFDNKNCWASIDLYKKCNYKIFEFEDIDDFKEFNMNHMVKIGEFSEKLENIFKAVEDLKKELEILKENFEVDSKVDFKKDPECDSETFCGLPTEEAKRIIRLYTATKKEPITDWATYIQGFESGAKIVSEEFQRIIKDTNDQFQQSLEVLTK